MAQQAPEPAAGVGVTPTHDNGARRGDTPLWDESSRPSGPSPEPGHRYTGQQRAVAQHLVDVHDHLRAELDQLDDLVDQVAAGMVDPVQARSVLHDMAVRQDAWTLGAYCATYCRVVATHHTIEDLSVFPHLRRADPRLAPVVDRLADEHHAIHGVLDRVDRALVALVYDRHAVDGITGLRVEMDLLHDALRSHLAYEERELIEPLARLGFA
jgi:hemerythrin-like domain-containing protein